MCQEFCPQEGHASQGNTCVVGVCMARGHAWQGVYIVGGHAWQEECMAWGACMAGGTWMTGGQAWQRVCMAGEMHGRGHVQQREACMVGVGACMAGDTATAADGTHPTRMHSCLKKYDAFLWIFFFKASSQISVPSMTNKNVLTDNYYKTTSGQVRSEYSSCKAVLLRV